MDWRNRPTVSPASHNRYFREWLEDSHGREWWRSVIHAALLLFVWGVSRLFCLFGHSSVMNYGACECLRCGKMWYGPNAWKHSDNGKRAIARIENKRKSR